MRTELALVALAVIAAAPSTADAGACVPGFDFAIFAKDQITIQGNAGTDSWDSTAGSYNATHRCGDADIGSNTTSSRRIIMQGSTTVCGDVAVGEGGDPDTVVLAQGNAKVTGNKAAQTKNQPLPHPTPPGLANASKSNQTFQNKHAVLPPNLQYGRITCQNGSLTLTSGQYEIESMTLQGNCELRVTSGQVEVYFSSSLTLQGGVVANETGVPGNLVFYGTSSASAATFQGGVDANFAVYAPEASCTLQGNVDMFGAVVCEDVTVQGNAEIHYDAALSTLAGGGFACAANEVSRANPIVATVDGDTAVVQGTFESPSGTPKTLSSSGDLASFEFPYVVGHMRARTASSITTTETAFTAGTELFDAADHIPSVSNGGCGTFTGACRNVFTVTQTPDSSGRSFHPARVQLNDSTASTIGALIAPTSAVSGMNASRWQTLVRAVLASELGGVDRSTVAVIPPSPVAGLASRPTIAYFGATDGMLHAVCASTNGTTETATNVCPGLGTELWAFVPRVQLPLIRRNAARVDGSVRVIDAFGDFVNDPATGQKTFRTILTFQTGYADASIGAVPAVYALDVTDPANPIVLWEVTAPSAKGTHELGVGLTLAAGTTIVGGKQTNLVFAETNNGGTGGAGVVATALALETGAEVWQFGFSYPSPPRGSSAALPLPATGVPGGAVAVDLRSSGFLTDLVMGDLFGNLWRLDAATGTSKTGTGVPLFQFSGNKHPIGMAPAIYSDGASLFAAFASGGYADPSAVTWSSGTQSLIAIKLEQTGPYPITETTTGKLAFKQNLAAGQNAFAQITVVGQQLFLTTDSSDVNATGYGTGGATGHVVSYNLASSATTVVAVRGGASSIAASGATLYSSSSDMQQRLSNDAASTNGASVDTATVPKLERRLWLKTE